MQTRWAQNFEFKNSKLLSFYSPTTQLYSMFFFFSWRLESNWQSSHFYHLLLLLQLWLIVLQGLHNFSKNPVRKLASRTINRSVGMKKKGLKPFWLGITFIKYLHYSFFFFFRQGIYPKETKRTNTADRVELSITVFFFFFPQSE